MNYLTLKRGERREGSLIRIKDPTTKLFKDINYSWGQSSSLRTALINLTVQKIITAYRGPHYTGISIILI